MAMAMAKLLCLITSLLAISTIPSAHSLRPKADKCSDHVFSLASCLSYAIKGSRVHLPDKDCCKAVAKIVDTIPDCICPIVDSFVGFGVNMSQALELPEACSVKGAPHDCKAPRATPRPPHDHTHAPPKLSPRLPSPSPAPMPVKPPSRNPAPAPAPGMAPPSQKSPPKKHSSPPMPMPLPPKKSPSPAPSAPSPSPAPSAPSPSPAAPAPSAPSAPSPSPAPSAPSPPSVALPPSLVALGPGPGPVAASSGSAVASASFMAVLGGLALAALF